MENMKKIYDWESSKAVDMALEAGCRVELCVTLFGRDKTKKFLSNEAAWTTLINNLVKLVGDRGAHGVNIDFEHIHPDYSAELSKFLIQLSKKIHSKVDDSSVSIAVPAVDWSGVFDIQKLSKHIDAFIIMGYDYYGKWEPIAGPTAPVYSRGKWRKQCLNTSVNYYLNQGVPEDKLILGLPYYGNDYITDSPNIPAKLEGFIGPVTYNKAVTQFFYRKRYFDSQSCTPYYLYKAGDEERQCWMDDEKSLRQKFDIVNYKDIAGVGIWALGYDNGYPEIWKALSDKFTNCGSNRGGTIYDTGGPDADYLPGENHHFVLRAGEGKVVKASFNEFNLQSGSDYLTVYDGRDNNGDKLYQLSGDDLPESIQSKGRSLYFEFSSDSKGTSKGYSIEWEEEKAPSTGAESDSEPELEEMPGSIIIGQVSGELEGRTLLQRRITFNKYKKRGRVKVNFYVNDAGVVMYDLTNTDPESPTSTDDEELHKLAIKIANSQRFEEGGGPMTEGYIVITFQ